MLLEGSTTATYIVRWPPWVGALMALGLLAAMFSAAAAGLRRLLGRWAVALAAVLYTSGFVAILGAELRSRQAAAWATLGVLCFSCAVVPSLVIDRLERQQPPPSFGRTVAHGIGATYAAALACVLGTLLLVGAVWLWRATVA